MGRCLLAAALLCGADASVCNIPVFRYALERWPASPYPAVVFYRGESPKVTLEDGALNLGVEIVDVGRPLTDEHRWMWEAVRAPSVPWLALRFPGEERILAWSGPYDPAALRGLALSPSRRETVGLIAKGASAVWLLVESGDADRDAKAAGLLTTELAKLEKSIRIPEPSPDDPPLRSDLPLKVSFPVLRVSAAAPEEAAFVQTLRRGWPGLALPAAFPVFGRGRTLGGLYGQEFDAASIEALAKYITAACSCEVKEFNPGIDLLIAADWERLLELGPEPEVKPLPPVVIPPGQKDAPARRPAPSGRMPFLLGAALATLGLLAVLLRMMRG
jgi:hypothetical protein